MYTMMPIMLLRPARVWRNGEIQMQDNPVLSRVHAADFSIILTCRDKEDASAEDHIVARFVKLTGCYTQTSEEQQSYAEDGKEAGSSYRS